MSDCLKNLLREERIVDDRLDRDLDSTLACGRHTLFVPIHIIQWHRTAAEVRLLPSSIWKVIKSIEMD